MVGVQRSLASLLFAMALVCALIARAKAENADSTSNASDGAASKLILLISDRLDDPFVERIRAELVAIGFTTIARQNDGAIERAAREVNAMAAVRILPTRQGVEVWMADRTSGRSLLRQVIVDENPAGPNQSVVALQTAELLRTSLLEAPATHPSDARPAAPPVAAAAPTPPAAAAEAHENPAAPRDSNAPPSAGLQAAFGALYSPGGADSALQLWISLERSLTHHVALALDLSAPLRNAALSGPEGTTHIGAYLAGAAFLLQTRAVNDRVFVNAGLGLGALRVSFDSDANAPLLSRSSGVTTVASYVRSDVGVELVPWLRLGARASCGAALNRVDIDFAGNAAGSWGRLFTGAFLLAEVPWR